ncbi:serine/threonine-protein kinase AtPK2/AtPK19 [Spatholobus suberectus]|nr:serine/threonine-protein kinase AtPK2/AtPK19 [Spatholobus suberectus]
MVSTFEKKKSLHSLMAANLSKLIIPTSSSSSSPNPSPSQSQSVTSPHVIHSRSHSFVGPSPRFAPSSSTPLFFVDEVDDEEKEPPGPDPPKIGPSISIFCES